MGKKAVISLGSNIEKEKNLPNAIRMLSKMCSVLAVSSIYETRPVGSPDPIYFWNAAVLIETDLDPAQLRIQLLAPIEQKLRRVRSEDKYAPRTIDLDLILYGNEIVDIDEDHHIPDPELLRFLHLAKPVAELIPDEIHPEAGRTFREVVRVIEDAESGDRQEVVARISQGEVKKLLH